MTIDPTKIKPGDKITCEFVVREGVDSSGYLRAVAVGGLRWSWLSAESITSHTPVPREFKVGDRVRFKGNPGSTFELVGPPRVHPERLNAEVVTVWGDLCGYVVLSPATMEHAE